MKISEVLGMPPSEFRESGEMVDYFSPTLNRVISIASDNVAPMDKPAPGDSKTAYRLDELQAVAALDPGEAQDVDRVKRVFPEFVVRSVESTA